MYTTQSIVSKQAENDVIEMFAYITPIQAYVAMHT